MSGIESINLSHEDYKKLVVEQTTGKWETAKSITQRIIIIAFLALVTYVLYLMFEWYFWLNVIISLPIAYWIANKIIRVKVRWFLKIDIKTQTIYFYAVPKSYRWNGQALPLKDNADNVLNVVNSIDYSTIKKTVKTTFTLTDYDRIQALYDMAVLDNVLVKMEKLQIDYYTLKRNFWNNVLKKIRQLQVRSVEIPIEKILARPTINISDSTVGKSQETKKEAWEPEE